MNTATHLRQRSPAYEALARSLDGTLISRGAASFLATRDALTWNARKPKLCPDAIVQVQSVRDVCRSVRFAHEHGLKVAVRSTGHNYFGASIRDNGLLLDLGRLDHMEIDVANRRARLQPAVKSGRFLTELVPRDLAFPVGHAADVGLGGFLLNGGLGWNLGQWGAACMGVIGVEMVLASGELIYADAQQHADLFWAARGAGPGFFGAITRYDVKLRALPAVTADVVAFEIAALDTTAPWLEPIVASAPAGIEIMITLGTARHALSAVNSPSLSITVLAFADTAEVRTWLALFERSLPAGGGIGRRQCHGIRFDRLLQEAGKAERRLRMAADVCWSSSTLTPLLKAVQSLAQPLPSEYSYVMLQPVKMPATRTDASFSRWGTTFVAAYSFWRDPADDARCGDWIATFRDAVEPFKTGRYVGEADLSVSANRPSQCFSVQAWDRLGSLKRLHDPQDTFFWYPETG